MFHFRRDTTECQLEEEQRNMMLISRAAHILSFVVTCAACCMSLTPVAHGQKASLSTAGKNSGLVGHNIALQPTTLSGAAELQR
jgi:hypothetical protein